MSDDLDRLRRTMGELAEYGGGTDLYDRTLRTSRRLTRRRHALAGGAVAVAVLGLGVPVALAGWHRSAPPPVAATPTTATPTAATPAPPQPSPPAPARPSTARSTAPAPPSSPTSRASSSRPPTGCPVGAATLRRVTDLPEGWTLEDVTCVEGWAQARPKAPTEAQQGDGVVLYRYANGKWREVVEGSAIECAAHGLPERIGRQLSSCYYD